MHLALVAGDSSHECGVPVAPDRSACSRGGGRRPVLWKRAGAAGLLRRGARVRGGAAPSLLGPGAALAPEGVRLPRGAAQPVEAAVPGGAGGARARRGPRTEPSAELSLQGGQMPGGAVASAARGRSSPFAGPRPPAAAPATAKAAQGPRILRSHIHTE